MQRDSLASHIGHHSRLLYFACAENQSMARMKNQFLLKMIQPTGPPPEKDKEEFFPS